ncbi:MAG: hypothetical protein AB1730_15745 [Myxococcota bacterium]
MTQVLATRWVGYRWTPTAEVLLDRATRRWTITATSTEYLMGLAGTVRRAGCTSGGSTSTVAEEADGLDEQPVHLPHIRVVLQLPGVARQQKEIMDCLEAVIYEHLERTSDPKKTKEEIQNTKLRVPGEGDYPSAPTKKGKVSV